jgi:hypothetical protein
VRAKHPWPPTLTLYESWREPFRRLAQENGFQPEDIDEAGARLQRLIDDIDAAGPVEGAEAAATSQTRERG